MVSALVQVMFVWWVVALVVFLVLLPICVRRWRWSSVVVVVLAWDWPTKLLPIPSPPSQPCVVVGGCEDLPQGLSVIPRSARWGLARNDNLLIEMLPVIPQLPQWGLMRHDDLLLEMLLEVLEVVHQVVAPRPWMRYNTNTAVCSCAKMATDYVLCVVCDVCCVMYVRVYVRMYV